LHLSSIASPTAYTSYYLIVALFHQMMATKADAPSLSLSLFLFDQFPTPNNGITSSPHVPTQRCLFSDLSPNVDTDYWLIVVFLKQTAAIKVEVPPTSLIFNGCHSGTPNKGTGAGKSKTDGSRPAHTRKGTAAR
jgi:hypothetical protein